MGASWDVVSETPGVVLVEDHVIVAEALQLLLSDAVGPITMLHSGEALLRMFDDGCAPSLVICDIGLPGISGVDALRELRSRGYATPFLVLTMHADAALAHKVLRLGAQGFVLKSSAGDELVRAIREVQAGQRFVSPSIGSQVIRLSAADKRRHGRPEVTEKQRQVLDLVIKGYRSKQIASELGLSIRTIESHRNALMHSFGVHSAVELIRVAFERRDLFDEVA
jgi:DNA-binding NarL/FixJ family response regulator